ncbi:MAG: hypothetical protein LBP63_09555 [Prevotellaceae bacterium]|jgi:hypothetical protein|nr:hypothetical protein [Prevotellaceae bacterium]
MEEIVISITKKEVQNKLNNTLIGLLLEDNFKLRKSSGFIYRTTQGKVESIYFRIINYCPLCQEIGCVMFDVRFDKVEDIAIDNVKRLCEKYIDDISNINDVNKAEKIIEALNNDNMFNQIFEIVE